MPDHRVVIGLDGGGTYTRVLCCELTGAVLATAQGEGAHPGKNPEAERHVREAIQQVLARAGRGSAQVAALVAGLAGLDEPADQRWAQQFTRVPGLTVEPLCVNDALVAWAGALALQPGIVAISGTGAIVFGRTASQREVRNYDFHHHTSTTARDLGFEVVFRILAGEATLADAPLLAAVLGHFQVGDVQALAEVAARNETLPYPELVRLYSGLAPLVTQFASQCAPLACQLCDEAVTNLARGIRLVASLFSEEPIPVALIGGVARSPYIQQRLQARLTPPRFRVSDPILQPEAGAILFALQHSGVPITDGLVERLRTGRVSK
jgi:glucosamine kinase